MKPNALPNEAYGNESIVSASAHPSVYPCQVRAQVSNRLSIAGPGECEPEKVAPQPKLTGCIYRINGRRYGLTKEGMVYDLQGQQFVSDARICDQVFDQYEERKQMAAAIRKEAEGLAGGNPAMEEAIRLSLATAGLLQTKANVGEEAVA